MNAKIYSSLFRRRDKFLLAGFFAFFLFIAVAVSASKRDGNGEGASAFFILIPPLGLGILLAEIWNRPLRRPAMALLPALQRTLFPWHAKLMLLAALAWAIVIRSIASEIPFAAAMGLSGAMFTLPLPFVLGQPAGVGRVRSAFIWAVIIGINVPFLVQGFGIQLLTHAKTAGLIGLILTAINLWLARKWKPRESLARRSIPARPMHGFGRRIAAIFRKDPGQSETLSSAPMWNYPPRGTSLLRWVHAGFQENPSGFGGKAVGCTLLILACPLVILAVGSPLEWYRVVVAPDEGGNSISPAMVLTFVMIGMSMNPGLLRPGQLYTISRRRRVSVAFVTSATGLAFTFFAIVGGSVLTVWIVGETLGLPLPLQPVVEFITKMAAVVPFMPLLHWGALRMEMSPSATEVLLYVVSIVLVATMVIAIQSLVPDAGLMTGAAMCVVATIVSQLIYHASLRDFYTKGDLLQRA